MQWREHALSRRLVVRSQIECFYNNIDDAIRAKYDDEADNAPKDSLLPFRAFSFISRMCNEFKRSPEK